MKKTAPTESKSLKTFYLYVVFVIVLILVALLVKGFFIIRDSRFDSSHDFTLAVIQQQNVKEIVAFHPQVPSISVLVMQDTNDSYKNLAKEYGITTDGYVQSGSDSNLNSEMTSFMWQSVLHTESWPSNLTIFDKIRLMLLSKGITTNNKIVEKISLHNQTPQETTTITTALTDQEIADENISVQIINATDITGFGQRFSRVLTNMGANIVDVSTSQDTQKRTTIEYFGDPSYTVKRLEKLLGVTATKITTQPIANIVVILGEDKRITTEF